jgi:hypothetical protein
VPRVEWQPDHGIAEESFIFPLGQRRSGLNLINYIFRLSHKSSFFETNLASTRPVAERFCPTPPASPTAVVNTSLETPWLGQVLDALYPG